ncbi:hypothetical protein GCM10028832_07210 [Streptomyces sparsus]
MPARRTRGQPESTRSTGIQRGAKSPNPTPPEPYSIRHISSERSKPTLSNASRTRKSPRPDCELHEEPRPTCSGREHVVLVNSDGCEQHVCPGHGAALWLTDPTLRFSAKTRTEAIAAVMSEAFGGGR